MNEWISVEDRLPETCLLVIVFGGIAEWTGSEWLTHTSSYARPIQWKVTHWMLLPEPPEKI